MKKFSLILSLTLAISSVGMPAVTQAIDNQPEAQYQRLKTGTSNFFGSTNTTFSVPDFLYGEPLFKSQHTTDSAEQIVNNFLKSYPDLFQTTLDDFRIEVDKPKNRTITQVHLFQQYQNIPVFGGEAIFTLNDKQELISYTGKYIPQLSISVVPKTTAKEIQTIVANDLQVEAVTQKPKLFIFNKGVLTDTVEPTQLVWRLGTNGWVYFVNANTKAIVYKYNDENDALTREVDTASGGMPTLPGSLVISEGDDTSTISDDDAKNAYNYSADVYNFYNSHFSLDSFDDSGAAMFSTTDYDFISHPDFGHPNAMWCNANKDNDSEFCPEISEVVFSDAFTVFDVTAHEWTHAVDDYAIQDEANGLYGLTYADESGALNESYSDIFGVLIEAEYGKGLNWDLGEDLPSGSPYRNLENPLASLPAQVDNWTNYDLGGDVHKNSGIPNKAAALIIDALGQEKSDNIFYYALRDQLTVATTFRDNYYALMATCFTLDVADITPSDCEAIFDAYATVGVNTDLSYAWAVITASATSGTAPLAITFDGADSVGINSAITYYVWDFGDGTAAGGGAVSHTFTDPGTYTVTLTIIDSAGYVNHTSQTITVYATGTISNNTTWTVDHSPYVISGGLTVSSGTTLTIDPGVVVKFLDSSSSINISGTLNAIGNSTTPIVFTSYKDDIFGGDTNGDGSTTTPAAGDWYTMIISGSSTANLDYVTMQYGGYSGYPTDYAMLLIDDNATNVSVNHSTLQNSQYYTIEIDPGSTSTITNSTITNNTRQPAIYITGGTSTLTANAISAASSYGVYVNNASPILTGNRFTESDYGVYVTGSSAAPTITNNTLTGNYYPIYFNSITADTSLTNNIGSGNTYNLIVLSGATIGDLTLNTTNELLFSFYAFSVSAGTTLTINPGMVVKFLNSGSALTINGTLHATGTNTESIIFTSYKDDTFGGDTNGDGTATSPAAGDWFQFKIASLGTATLDYVTMQYGGYGNIWYDRRYPMFSIDDNAASVSVDHSTLRYNNYNTMEIDPGSTSTISNSTITNTYGYSAIYMTGGTATLTNNTLTTGSTGGGGGLVVCNASPTVTNNSINGGTTAMYLYNASPTITGNTFDAYLGLSIGGSTSAPFIENNTFIDNEVGIGITDSSTPIITGNLITGNTYGIFVSNSANPTLTNNQIYDNTNYGLYNSSTTTLTAESNWWGSSTGPYNSTTNPTGTGNTVSNNVDFTPWLTVDPAADITPPAEVTLGTSHNDVWNKTITLNWTNPTDADFSHVRIDRTDVVAGTTTTLSSTETGTSYNDTTLSYNLNYLYTLYTVDTTGNVSTGVTTTSQRVRSPAPTNLALTAGNTSITATWTASSAPASTLQGYKVYYGTSPSTLTSVVTLGKVTTTTLTGLTNGTRYYVAVTAFSKTGLESPQSVTKNTRPHP